MNSFLERALRPLHPKRSWRRWHLWIGVAAVSPLVFYAITGIALNHRARFGYFQNRTVTTRSVPPRDAAPVRNFLDFYKGVIDREDDPTVVRLRDDGIVEFLYGSHGRITYAVDPASGTVTRTEKTPSEPWATLNRLHKAVKTPGSWAVFSDVLCGILGACLVTGLLIRGAWRRSAVALTVSTLLFAFLTWLAAVY